MIQAAPGSTSENKQLQSIILPSSTGKMYPSESPVQSKQMNQVNLLTRTPPPTRSVQPTQTCTPALINCLVSPLEGFQLEELRGIVYRGIVDDSPGLDSGHYGVDFLFYFYEDKGQSILGTPIRASMPGKVVSVVEWFPETELGYPFGNMVILETNLSDIDPVLLAPVNPPEEGSLYILYAHMLERPYVEMGDYVLAGQVLGRVGNTGDSDAPHLHWEMRFGPSNAVFGYMTYYNTRATLAQMEAYERWRLNGEFEYIDPMLLVPQLPEGD